MSKPRVQLQAVVDTMAHAETIRDAIVTQLVGKDIFDNLGVQAFTDDADGSIMVTADVRFNSRTDRDTIKNWIKDRVQNHPQVKTWVQSVKLTTHLCSHDDGSVKDCRTTEFVLEFER